MKNTDDVSNAMTSNDATLEATSLHAQPGSGKSWLKWRGWLETGCSLCRWWRRQWRSWWGGWSVRPATSYPAQKAIDILLEWDTDEGICSNAT